MDPIKVFVFKRVSVAAKGGIQYEAGRSAGQSPDVSCPKGGSLPLPQV